MTEFLGSEQPDNNNEWDSLKVDDLIKSWKDQGFVDHTGLAVEQAYPSDPKDALFDSIIDNHKSKEAEGHPAAGVSSGWRNQDPSGSGWQATPWQK